MSTESSAEITTHDADAMRHHWYATGWYAERTTGDALAEGAATHGSVPVVFSGTGASGAGSTMELTTDVGEIYSTSVRLAAVLQDWGVGPGDTVAVQLPLWRECLVAYQAVLLTGATLVPIVHIYGPTEVSFILRESGAKVFVMPARVRSTDYADRVAGFDAIPSVEKVVVVGTDAPAEAVAWHELTSTSEFVAPAASADDIAVLCYTSGTTSAPKGVQHSHNSLLAELRTGPQLLSAAPDAVHLLAFPPGHIAGVVSVLRPTLQGTRPVCMEHWDPAAAVDLIAEHGVTSMVGTPFHLSGVLDVPRAVDKLSSLTEVMVGAAAVPDELGRRAERAGIRTFRCYGSTEHPTITVGSVDDPAAARMYTDGSPLPGVAVRIVDDAGRDVPVGTDGEIVTRGPDQFVGYRDPALDADAFTADGWMRTGDLGHLDDAGQITVTDRLKDVIIRAGETISSGQIEDVLNAHPAVAEAVVVAAPDDRYGEVAAAVVVLEPDATLDIEGVRAHFATSGLAKQKTPEQLVIVESLPRTAVGKIRKADIRREYFSDRRR